MLAGLLSSKASASEDIASARSLLSASSALSMGGEPSQVLLPGTAIIMYIPYCIIPDIWHGFDWPAPSRCLVGRACLSEISPSLFQSQSYPQVSPSQLCGHVFTNQDFDNVYHAFVDGLVTAMLSPNQVRVGPCLIAVLWL